MKQKTKFFVSIPEAHPIFAAQRQSSASRAEYEKKRFLFLFPRCRLSSAEPKIVQTEGKACPTAQKQHKPRKKEKLSGFMILNQMAYALIL